MQSSSSTRESPLDDVATLVTAVIKEPVREAVREALEQERQSAATEHEKVRAPTEPRETATPSESGGTGSRFGRGMKVTGLFVVAAVLSYLVRRREAVLAAAPISDRVLGGSEATDAGSSQSAAATTADETYAGSETGPDATVQDE